MPQQYSAVHTLSYSASTVDLVEIAAPSTRVVRVTKIQVGQDSDDATSESEMLPITFQRASASGSGGSTLTAGKMEAGFASAASTLEGGNTTAATLSTPVLIHDTFNVLSGWEWVGSVYLAPSTIGVLRIPANPSDSIDLKVTVEFEEIG